MSFRRIASLLVVAACGWMALAAQAQVPQYGPNVTYDQARKALAGAIADARRQNLPMAVAVVDTAGQLVVFERMDNTQTGSVAVAQDKAVSAAMYPAPDQGLPGRRGRRRRRAAHR